MSNEAPTDHPLHALLAARRSPRVFADRPVPPEALRSLFEAARWSASCFNEQPWRFLVAPRAQEADFAALFGCLTESNQRWAGQAAVLMLSVGHTRFAHNGETNRHTWHDVGLATGQLFVEATALGLVGHAMAGFDRAKARAVLGVPEECEPIAMIALGYPGEVSDLPQDLAQKETAVRVRRAQHGFVFGAHFGTPLVLESEAPWDPVLRFWFGALDAEGFARPAKEATWFRKDSGFDGSLRQNFGTLHAAMLAGDYKAWQTDPRGRLAAVIVLDQFTRNLFRDTGHMFQADAMAQALALDALEQGDDRHLAFAERWFLYMPLMHAEDVALQDRCVALFEAMAAESPRSLSMAVQYAKHHRDIVARFGRFPHRNALLGRESTPEEIAFLKEPNSSF